MPTGPKADYADIDSAHLAQYHDNAIHCEIVDFAIFTI
jgi:hypothetical protein